jgi:hypothetical protein
MKFFYLKYYRHIHHILFAIELWFFFWLMGIHQLLYPTRENLTFILTMLIINFVFSDLVLKWSGIKKMVDDEVSDILKKIKEYEKEQREKENQNS